MRRSERPPYYVIDLSSWGVEGIADVLGLAVFFGAYLLLYKRDGRIRQSRISLRRGEQDYVSNTGRADEGSHHVREDERGMELREMPYKLTVCKVADVSDIDLTSDFFFVGKTDEEVSLVCKTEAVPPNTIARDDGWRGLRIQGILDFSMIGILSNLSGILAWQKISIFAVSTYNTDYILVKEENFERALEILEAEGYAVSEGAEV